MSEGFCECSEIDHAKLMGDYTNLSGIIRVRKSYRLMKYECFSSFNNRVD